MKPALTIKKNITIANTVQPIKSIILRTRSSKDKCCRMRSRKLEPCCPRKDQRPDHHYRDSL